MCGLFGFSHHHEINRILTPVLAYEMETRGMDSWGVTDGDFVYKDTGPITIAYKDLEIEAPSYHTRGASVGNKTVRNAHPFDFTKDGRRVVGMHNGHISNWQSLKKKYDRNDLEVDSEHIFLQIAENKPLAELAGWGAVVWYEMEVGKEDERERYFSKFGGANMDNLHFCRLAIKNSPIIYASTRVALSRAAAFANVKIDKSWDPDANKRYFFMQDPTGEWILAWDLELPWCKEPFSEPVTPKESARSTYGYARRYPESTSTRSSSTDTGICAAGNCQRNIIPGRQLICTDCISTLKAEYLPMLPYTDQCIEPWCA